MADMASELEAIAFRLRRAGETDLARELNRAMRDAVNPVPGQIQAELDPHMPRRYAETLDADLDIGVIARNPGGADADAAVAVFGKARAKGRKLRYLDAGRLTHPLFGDREHWYTQDAPPSMVPGWFTGPAEAAGPQVHAALEQALRDVSDKATGA